MNLEELKKIVKDKNKTSKEVFIAFAQYFYDTPGNKQAKEWQYLLHEYIGNLIKQRINDNNLSISIEDNETLNYRKKLYSGYNSKKEVEPKKSVDVLIFYKKKPILAIYDSFPTQSIAKNDNNNYERNRGQLDTTRDHNPSIEIISLLILPSIAPLPIEDKSDIIKSFDKLNTNNISKNDYIIPLLISENIIQIRSIKEISDKYPSLIKDIDFTAFDNLCVKIQNIIKEIEKNESKNSNI